METHFDDKLDVLDYEIADLFRLKDRPVVTQYLSAHTDLAPFLVQCHQKVREHFGSNAGASLDVFSDPESGDQKLFVLVATERSVKDARECLTRLDQDWLLDIPAEILTKFNIDVEYV